jgi:hypothetical protein
MLDGDAEPGPDASIFHRVELRWPLDPWLLEGSGHTASDAGVAEELPLDTATGVTGAARDGSQCCEWRWHLLQGVASSATCGIGQEADPDSWE